MSALTQLRGALIAAFLGPTGQRLRRHLRQLSVGELPGRGGLEVYHDPGDPVSHLLLGQLARALPEWTVPATLYVVGPPTPDVDPAPDDRRAYRRRDALRLSRRHDLPLPETLGVPSAAAVSRVRRALGAPGPFADQLDLALRLGDRLWADDPSGLDAALRGLPSIDVDHTARMRRRGFYAGGSVYYRGEWFPDLDRWPYLEAELRGASVAPLALPGPGAGPGSAPAVDLYFSFRSPYSYLALERLFQLADHTGAAVTVRPVLPMVMRDLAVPRVKRQFLVQDAAREARRHGIPFGRIADPLGEGVERCLAVLHRLREPARRRDFVRVAARGIWSEALDVATDADLRTICERVGLSWSDVQDALVDDGWRREVADNQAALRAAGVWGVPSFVVGDRALWGQDRLDVLAEWLTA